MKRLRNAIIPAALAIGASIGLSSCTRSPAPDAGSAASPDAPQSASAPAAACDALRKRVAACLENVRNGSLQLEFDPTTMTDPVQCQQTNEKFTLLAKVVRCEDAAPATP